MSSTGLAASDITGLVLAGGRGTRMGGIDKGLQPHQGQPLVAHALTRLSPQAGTILINANRHLDIYAGFGVPVLPDHTPDYAGPLAGFLAGLENAVTPYLVTVPCDSPRFPLDLVARMGTALQTHGTSVAMASAPETDDDGRTRLRAQPVFCLMRVELKTSLRQFLQAGGRKIDRWTDLHHTVIVPFDAPGDDPLAFANINTLADLKALSNPESSRA